MTKLVQGDQSDQVIQGDQGDQVGKVINQTKLIKVAKVDQVVSTNQTMLTRLLVCFSANRRAFLLISLAALATLLLLAQRLPHQTDSGGEGGNVHFLEQQGKSHKNLKQNKMN